MIYTPDAQLEADSWQEGLRVARSNTDLSRKQVCAADLGRLATPSDIFEEAPGSWEELVDRTDAWLGAHIDTRDLDAYASSTDFSSTVDAVRHVRRVARDAVVTTAAYLEVLPKVLMHEEFEDPNRGIARYGSRSMGFMLAWSGLHDQVDKPLAFALAVSPPPQESIYDGMLHFNPKWFADVQGHVVLDPDKAPDLRDETHHRHPAQSDRGQRVLFGCPGRHMIPVIYRNMLQGAHDGELFAATYHTERMNHGYTEYHAEPEAATLETAPDASYATAPL